MITAPLLSLAAPPSIAANDPPCYRSRIASRLLPFARGSMGRRALGGSSNSGPCPHHHHPVVRMEFVCTSVEGGPYITNTFAERGSLRESPARPYTPICPEPCRIARGVLRFTHNRRWRPLHQHLFAEVERGPLSPQLHQIHTHLARPKL